MDWTIILDAATGRAEALNRVVRRSSNDHAALQTLLLLDDAPHPAAALGAVATVREDLAAPIHAALAPHVAPALAAWRADPHWAERAVVDQARRNLPWSVAGMVGALRADPAALHVAVAIVVRDGDSEAVAHGLDALGADGWRALADAQRSALLAKAPAVALGPVWGALDDAQRAAAAQRAESSADAAAQLIGRIGAAAWTATDPMLRERLIDAVARSPWWVFVTASAWPSMTDNERDALATAVIVHGVSQTAFSLLDALGAAGRATLTVEQRAALDQSAMDHPDAWRVLAWRAADAGWGALTDDERRAVLATAEAAPWRVAVLLRDVGAAGWRAMSADEQARIAGAVRRDPDVFFRCSPTLWTALGGDSPPPTRGIPDNAIAHWRAEDADADLGGLPPSHQAVVLALAPWRTEDATKDSVRVPRLCMAWHALTVDARVALATAQPRVLAAVAAAARLADGASAAVDAVGETVARRAAATDRAAATRIVAAMLRTPARWRAWMSCFAPSDADPPDVGKAWRDAARRGIVDDVTLCARLAAKEREESNPARALRRTGR